MAAVAQKMKEEQAVAAAAVQAVAEAEPGRGAGGTDDGEPAWRDDEDWALADATAAFTVGRGDEICTFWQALAASTPELSARSSTSCEQRCRALAQQAPTVATKPSGSEGQSLVLPIVGPQPPVLEDWTRTADGRYSGRIAGESSYIWVTAALEGRLAADPRKDTPGYIEAVGGRVYELSRAASVAVTTPVGGGGIGGGGIGIGGGGIGGIGGGGEMESSPASESSGGVGSFLTALSSRSGTGIIPSSPRNVVASLGAALFVGFTVGTSVAPAPLPLPPPPPPPGVTKIFIAPAGAPRPAAGIQQTPGTVGYPPASGGTVRPSAPLTVEEQRQRQELRVQRDEARIVIQQQRLREDQQALNEYKRIEAERGASADAVKLVFPSKEGP